MNTVPKPPARQFVFGHIEMGDALIMNGMIRYFARAGDPLVTLAKTGYIHAVREMYSDLPNVQVIGTRDYGEVHNRWLRAIPGAMRLGQFSPNTFIEEDWDNDFYRQAGVPIDERWQGFVLPRRFHPPTALMQEDFALVHQDTSRGYTIKPDFISSSIPIKNVTVRPSFWDWLPEIYRAREIHCIDSSYLNLVDYLWVRGWMRDTILVFHRYAKKYQGKAKWPTLKAPWRILA